MQQNLILLFIVNLTILVGSGQFKPTLSIANAFPEGHKRSYDLISDIRITDTKDSPTIEYKINGKLDVGAIWTLDNYSLLKFKLIKPKLTIRSNKDQSKTNYKYHASTLDSGKNYEFYALWHIGHIKHVFISNAEDQSMINLKKSLINLFQYQLLDGAYVENDVSGKCDVTYDSVSPEMYRKQRISCQSDLSGHTRADRELGATTHLTKTADFKVTSEGVLEKIESREVYDVQLVANKNVGHRIESIISLKFNGQIGKLSKVSAKNWQEAIKSLKDLKEQSLLTSFYDRCKDDRCQSFKLLIKDLKSDLASSKIGSSAAALALVKTIQSARRTSKEEFLKILNAHTIQELKGQLLDILGATQTIESHQAAMTILKITSDTDIDNVERYLQSLAVGSQPKDQVIEDLLKLLKKDFKSSKIKDTIVQTVASMTNRFAKNNIDHKIVEKVISFLTESLDKCKDPSCSEMYIRALYNLKQTKTMATLIDQIYSKERKIAVAAMKALESFPRHIWTKESKKALTDVFYQKTKKFDSSARTLALDVLLDIQQNDKDLENLLDFLQSNDAAYEVKQYLLQKIHLLSEKCSKFKQSVRKILAKRPQLNNYHIFGQRGLTTVLSRQFSKDPSFNGTLLSVQEIYNGVLKRGIVDMTVDANNGQLSVFTLGLYASGLSSFVGGSEPDDDETTAEPTTAGMEISVQGSHFRPLEFFNGQGELMGHVWSGTAAERTAAYTATTLLHDHSDFVRLQNGASLTVNIHGAVSIDLNGQVQFSLWNRNAHCQIDKNAGLALLGTINYDFGFMKIETEFIVTQEPKLNLVSDIDFSSDVQLCLQLSKPSTSLRHNITKVETLTGAQWERKLTKTISYHLPGSTFALNQKNNEMCNVIFNR